MQKPIEQILGDITRELQSAVGTNLSSCSVYGSAVRGNAVPGVSDINLLIVLEASTAAAHASLAKALARHSLVDPLIVERGAFARTARCFANKFSSIQRNYRVLHGTDPFQGLTIDTALERLLCEQALRNLRLRATYAFVMHGRQRDYGDFLRESISAIFVQLSDVLRLSGHEIPKDFAARIPLMTAAWSIGDSILQDLHALREGRRRPSRDELDHWHQRLLSTIDAVLQWIERSWPATTASR